MKILLLNQDWFAHEMRSLGHEVVSAGIATHLDVVLPRPVVHIDSVIENLPNGFIPDVILWLDNSAPLLITGFDETKIPTAMYSVDTHHHFDLHSYIAHLFDHVFIAQRDYFPAFASSETPLSWLPLWASRVVEPSERKDHQVTFVGNMNARLNPDRVNFFDQLQKLVPLHITQGEWWNIFPYSEIVVNQTVKRDLNFRVFEAMVTGSLLVTEASTNGLSELFNDHEHLVFYEKGDVNDAANKIKALLADLPRARMIAANGRRRILERHLPIHRAQQVLDVLTNLKKRPRSKKSRYAAMINFGTVSTMVEHTDTLAGTHAIIASLSAAQDALLEERTLGELESAHLVINAVRYDKKMRSDAGQKLINLYCEHYPDNKLLIFAKIRGMLNSGAINEAKKLASLISDEPAESVFSSAEHAICTLMEVYQD